MLQRTADNKYLRLDVDDADTLVGGFPKTREELFQYRGLILGSIEARYFTPDQLRMIASFVNQRGGGFLMLGGRSAFAEGGYVGTPIADILPVVLGEPLLIDGEPAFTEITVSPTRAGQTHPVMQVDDTEEASAERWRNLPATSPRTCRTRSLSSAWTKTRPKWPDTSTKPSIRQQPKRA